MAWHHSFMGDVLVVTAIIGIVLCFYAARRRSTPGALFLALLMCSAAAWALGNATELYLLGRSAKIEAAKFGYIGLVNMPVWWLLFAASFSDRAHWVTRRRVALLFVVPAFVLVMTFTNQWHGLVWPHIAADSAVRGAALHYSHGVVAWLNVTYCYALLLVGSALVVRTSFQSAALHRRQTMAVFLAVVIPWLANAAYFARLAPFTSVDFSPAAMIVSGLALSWTMFRFRLLSTSPVTYSALLATMEDGVLVVDAEGSVAELNRAAEELLAISQRAVGHHLDAVVTLWPGLAEHCLHGSAGRSQAALDGENDTSWLDVHISVLRDRRGGERGRLIVLRDATESHRAEELLRQRDVLLETVSHGAEMLLRSGEWKESIPVMIERLGEATGASRVYVFQNDASGDDVVCTQIDEWCAPGVRAQLDTPRLQSMPLRATGFGRWADVLACNGVIAGLVHELPPRERTLLHRQGVVSLLAVPIFVEGEWWGFIGFDECFRAREWTAVETEALRLAASIIGGALQRERSTAAVAESAVKARRMVEGAVQAMGALVETRDPYTAGHERRVAQLAAAIAEEVGLDESAMESLRLAACMHDVGKIGVPTELLTKPVGLSKAELALIREHPVLGAAILAGIEFDGPVAEIVRQHHERLDGSGYPDGLDDGSILPQARILAVADVAEAMASHRPYRPAFPLEDVIEELRRGAGLIYDADACEACERLFASGRFSFEWQDALRTGAAVG
jgi:putative nucleotidyltransferase with HDIG domain